MKSRSKRLCAILFTAIALSAIAAALVYLQVRQTIADSYAKWSAAQLVIAYYEATSSLPTSWSELKPHITQASHTASYDFTDVQQRIAIDFGRLPELTQHYPAPEQIPQIITAYSGSSAHWQGAEPNQLVNQALLSAQTETETADSHNSDVHLADNDSVDGNRGTQRSTQAPSD